MSNITFFRLLSITFFLNFWISADETEWDAGIHNTEKLSFQVETFVEGFNVPWGMAFMPDERMLVTDQIGDLWIVSRNGKDKFKVSGQIPTVWAKGQGGMMDVEIHPNFINNSYIYLSFSDILDNKSHTVVLRAKLVENKLIDGKIIFRADEKFYTKKSHHFGSRILFNDEGYLFISVGDRGDQKKAQGLDMPNGKIHRVHDDGSIPIDNPFYNTEASIKSIWSYGHRNPQGLVLHPLSREIWESEHGPKGGDEINIISKGHNYGWPVITYGRNYSGTIISKYTHKEGMDQPVFHWTPSIAVCGITFYMGNKFPEWNNNLLATSLKFERLHRVEMDGLNMVKDEIIYEAGSRVRDVEVGRDGLIYVALEDPGRIVRLLPYQK